MAHIDESQARIATARTAQAGTECTCPTWWFPAGRRAELRAFPHIEGALHHSADCAKARLAQILLARENGAECRRRGRPRDAYPRGSDAAREAWQEGWDWEDRGIAARGAVHAELGATAEPTGSPWEHGIKRVVYSGHDAGLLAACQIASVPVVAPTRAEGVIRGDVWVGCSPVGGWTADNAGEAMGLRSVEIPVLIHRLRAMVPS